MKLILTANELLSGATVYYHEDGGWHSEMDTARLFDEGEQDQVDAILERARQTGRLISLETEKVTVEGGRVVAQRLRERIRANGPTAPRHAIQPLKEGDHVSI